VAQASAASGDTVVLADGGYSGVALHLQASMSLTAAPGAHPVLHGDGTDAVVEVDAGTASVSGLTVTGGGTGIYATFAAGSLTVIGSTISGNDAGLYSVTQLTVTGSTIAANGTGLETQGPSAGQGLSVTNTTVSGNRNDGISLGKGVTSATLIGVTISDNGRFGLSEQGIADSGASVSLGSSLITGNELGCVYDNAPADAGYNVESGDTCALGSTSRAGVGDAAIGLQPLAANGSAGPQTRGPTNTTRRRP
jgi:nitrous oxidase accessory protein NosD